MTALIHYDAARKAIAAARAVDEVKDIRDRSEAMRVYAIQCKNRELEIDAAEIRIRAERRLGQMLREQKQTVGLADGGDAQRTRFHKGTESRPTLAKAGIDKKLSSRVQKLAEIPEEQFETLISCWRIDADKEAGRITPGLAKEAERQDRKASVSIPEIPSGLYSTIVVDPPWSYSNKSGRHGASVNAEYIQERTMTLEQVALFDIQRWTAQDCHLYLWVTDAYVGHVYTVTEAWGFKAKASLVWVKDRFGMGNYYRHQHELCIFAVKGKMRLARMNASTVFNAPITRHSEKPDEFYRLVESCSPGPYLDVFARKKRAGWDVFGDEITPEYQGTLDGRMSQEISV